MKKVFKHGCFGLYSENEYECTKKFGVQIREECVSIGEIIKTISLNKNNEINWDIFKLKSEDAKLEYINDENNYPLLFMDLSKKIYEKTQEYRNSPDYYRVWGSSTIPDIIINSVLQNMEALNNPVEICKNIVDKVM